MDEVLRRAMEPVLRDLQSTGVDEPRIEDRDWTDDPDSPSVMLWSPDGGGTGVYVSRFGTEVERVASMADQVQDWAIEDLWAGQVRTNWPRCPQHPDGHPMLAVVRGGVAVWTCPTTNAVNAEIGSLNA